MTSIEIDFDVFKALTARRQTEATGYNDVLREILGLPTGPTPKAAAGANGGRSNVGWTTKGVFFPAGTEFRATYDGQLHTAQVREGGLYVNGKRTTSVSKAASWITNGAVNGWTFWEAKFPGDTQWRSINGLRDR